METSTLFATILSVIKSIISTIGSYITNKKTQKQNIEINKAQIGEQLVLSTKLDNVNRIRQAAFDFISACQKYMDSNDSFSEKQEKKRIIKEKYLQFTLYLDPAATENDEIPGSDLCDPKAIAESTNKIIALSKKIILYLNYYHDLMDAYNKAYNEYNECYRCLYNGMKRNCIKANIDGDDIPFTNQECEEKLVLHDNQSRGIKKKILELQSSLDLLHETIRIYTKNEMDRITSCI